MYSPMRGCGGVLCQSFSQRLKRCRLVRYETNALGEPDYTSPVLTAHICVLRQSEKRGAGIRLKIEGRAKETGEYMLVAASSCEKPLAGDIVFCDGGRYRVLSREESCPERLNVRREGDDGSDC